MYSWFYEFGHDCEGKGTGERGGGEISGTEGLEAERYDSTVSVMIMPPSKALVIMQSRGVGAERKMISQIQVKVDS